MHGTRTATTPGLFTVEAEEAHLTELLDSWHAGGLQVESYGRMLRLAKRCARRHGLPLDDVLAA